MEVLPWTAGRNASPFPIPGVTVCSDMVLALHVVGQALNVSS